MTEVNDVLPGVRRSMQGNRSRDTRPELALRSLLHARGLRFRVSFRPLAGTRFTADVVFTRAKVAVFLDGCYWHGCPQHYRQPKSHVSYWAPKIARNRARDAKVDALLRAAGWHVIRIWEHEDLEDAAQRIDGLVRPRAEGC